MDSLQSAIKLYNNPSILTIQETKMRCKSVKLPGYQVFLKNREGLGGGLMTAVDENLSSVLVSSPESEILVVQSKVGNLNVRIINGYGPQEDEKQQVIFNFWQEIEKEIIAAKADNCCVIIQCDANAKLGKTVISNDSHEMSSNGNILWDILVRQNMYVLNADILCEGTITRQRKTKNKVEQSVLDYIIVCDVLKNYFESMSIDENRSHVLTKYASTKGVKCKVESDHNILYGVFSIKYDLIHTKVIREVFNFKNQECRKKFFEVSNNTNKFSLCFEENEGDFPKQANKFFRTLNGTFHECFKKIRITNKSGKPKNDEIQQCLQLKGQLTNFLREAKSSFSKQFIQNNIGELECTISKLSSYKNATIVKEQLKQLETPDGSFSQNGMWKVHSKLFPRSKDPPMAKLDKSGNLITAKGPLRDLYLQTYVQRLQNREMKNEYQEIFTLKTLLWKSLKTGQYQMLTRLSKHSKGTKQQTLMG